MIPLFQCVDNIFKTFLVFCDTYLTEISLSITTNILNIFIIIIVFISKTIDTGTCSILTEVCVSCLRQ